MYNIKISCKDENDNASYNIDIDTDVTITATVLDFNGEPVIGKSLTIYYDDETSIYTGTTNSNGQISITYTCTDWGVHTFLIETFSTSVNVTGWRTANDTADWKVMYNQDTVKCAIHIDTSLTYPTSWTLQNANILGSAKDTIKPSMPVTGVNYVGSNSAVAIREDGGFYKKSLTGSQVSVGTYCQLTWTYK